MLMIQHLLQMINAKKISYIINAFYNTIRNVDN